MTNTKTNHYFRALVALVLMAIVASLLAASAARPAHAATNTFTVNLPTDVADATSSDGLCDVAPLPAGSQCTLRAAIEQANATPGADAINFDISGTGIHTISPNAALPPITERVTINGYTQPGSSANSLSKGTNAKPTIEIDGSNAGFGAAGLTIDTSASRVIGLVIDRFSSAGVVVGGSGNTIQGDFIGTDPSGTKALGNGLAGVDVEPFLGDPTSDNTIGGFSGFSRNLISGNKGPGVVLSGKSAAGNLVGSNLIGTQKDGNSALGNAGAGVGIFSGASGSTVGGPNGESNTIAFNGSGGVVVGGSGDATTTGNSIDRNSIFPNAGLGIDLGNDGATPNDAADADTGPNTLLNKPILTSAKTVSGRTTIKGTLNSQPNKNFLVKFFSNPSGTDEGKRFGGQTVVTTDGAGNASFTFSPQSAVTVGKTVTATANDSSLDSSEFSAPRKVAS